MAHDRESIGWVLTHAVSDLNDLADSGRPSDTMDVALGYADEVTTARHNRDAAKHQLARDLIVGAITELLKGAFDLKKITRRDVKAVLCSHGLSPALYDSGWDYGFAMLIRDRAKETNSTS